MKIYKPEIMELLSLIEKRYQKALRTTTDFEEFSLYLKYQAGKLVSTSTLKRLWGYVNDNHTPRLHTLDQLSQYLGHTSFEGFCSWLKTSPLYNSSFFTTKQIMVSELHPGTNIEIGWAPNRYLRLHYQGDNQFKVTEARASKLLVGDCFEVVSFLMGQPLALPYVLRNGKRTSPFIAGRNGGLTLINTL